MLKRIILMSAYIFIMFIIIINIPMCVNIETVALEVIYNDHSHIEERAVSIQGRYSIDILRGHHEFVGTIEILEYPETHNVTHHLRMVDAGDNFRHNPLFLHLPDGIDEMFYYSHRVHFGEIFVRDRFSDVMIWVDVPGEALSNSPVIVAGAETREEALERLSALFAP